MMGVVWKSISVHKGIRWRDIRLILYKKSICIKFLLKHDEKSDENRTFQKKKKSTILKTNGKNNIDKGNQSQKEAYSC